MSTNLLRSRTEILRLAGQGVLEERYKWNLRLLSVAHGSETRRGHLGPRNETQGPEGVMVVSATRKEPD